MTDSGRDYHLMRAEREERLAAEAADPATIRAHRELAGLHRARAEEVARTVEHAAD